MALKKPVQFSVEKQQRNADLKNIKLTQYMVRLQFDGLKEPSKAAERLGFGEAKRVPNKKRRPHPDDSDFDSEVEYGREDEESEEDEVEESGDEGDFGDEAGEDEISGEDEFVSDDDQEAPKPTTSGKKGKKAEPVPGEYSIKQAPVNEYLVKREATLICLLQKSFKQRVIIFCNEKLQVSRLFALLTAFGFKAAEVQGNMTQADRLSSIESFQQGKVEYLVATDVIARGLDLPNVKAVINFSFPTEPKRYLHRIGRTARAGQHGVSVTLCNEEERKDLKKLSRKMNHHVNTFSI